MRDNRTLKDVCGEATARRAVQILAANSKQAVSFQFVYYASSLRKQPIFYDAIVLDVFPAQRRLRYEPRNLYLGSASDWLKICLIFRGCLRGGRKILAPGRSQKADHPSAICFLRSVYMQRPRVVLVPRAMIFLLLGYSILRGRKICAPCKLLSLSEY